VVQGVRVQSRLDQYIDVVLYDAGGNRVAKQMQLRLSEGNPANKKAAKKGGAAAAGIIDTTFTFKATDKVARVPFKLTAAGPHVLTISGAQIKVWIQCCLLFAFCG